MKDIILYKTEDQKVELEVRLNKGTIWLDQRSISELFDVNVPAISKHISNIFDEGELQPNRAISKMEIVQKEGNRKVKRNVEVYNLDAIISIGYRVNSQKATQFRIWATNVLRDYIIKGYKINEKRLKASEVKFTDLQRAIRLLDNVIKKRTLQTDEAQGLLKVITDYNYALNLFDQYDKNKLKIQNVSKDTEKQITYEDLVDLIKTLQTEIKTGYFFGQEKGMQLKSIAKMIYQTFDGKELYASTEEKAANLLYFMIKDHPFADGNKRIAAATFLYFLNINGILYSADGSMRIANNTLVALALMIAESNPKDRDIILKVTINLINRSN